MCGKEAWDGSLAWLASVGICFGRPQERISLEGELIRTPAILEVFSQIGEILDIASINALGITFYLTDHPFCFSTRKFPNARPIVAPARADGWLFVPMANVVCVNEFGGLGIAEPPGGGLIGEGESHVA